MAAIVAPSSSPSSSPSLERRARSRSFGAVTPTFSGDLAKLKALTSSESAASSSSGSIVHSFQEAIAIAKTLDVLGTNSPLRSKLILNGEDDWINFIKNSGAVVVTSTTGANNCGSENSGVGGFVCGGEGEEKIAIHLEKLLRHCFDIAYKLPPNYSQSTSSSAAARTHMRSSSLAALAAFATNSGERENSVQV